MGGRGAGSGNGPQSSGGHRRGDQRSVHPIDISKGKWRGLSLEKGESIIRKRAREVLLAYDENGKLQAAYQGNKQSVAFPTDLMTKKGWTVTHGHPKGDANFGGTFSFADVHNFNRSQWSEHRATASGKGEMNYILRANAKSNKKGFDQRLSRDEKRLERRYNAVYERVYNKTGNHHVARQRATGLLQGYYKRVAPQYGIEFVSRKKDYKYGR